MKTATLQLLRPFAKVLHLFLLPLIFYCLSGSLSAQLVTIDLQLVGSAGSTYYIENTCITSSVGESVVNTLERTDQPSFTQGFQQTFIRDRVVSVSSYQSISDWSISLYPNPTTDLVQLQIESKRELEFQVEVLDYLGRKIFSKEVQAFSTPLELDCRSLASGTYWVRVQSKNQIAMRTKPFQVVR